MHVHVNKDSTAEVEEPTVEIHHRASDSPETVEALSKALWYGSRRQRRAPIDLGGDADKGASSISRKERNRRNARRRVAKQTRKRNGR